MHTEGLRNFARSLEGISGQSVSIRTGFGPGLSSGFGPGLGSDSGARARGLFLFRGRSWFVGTALGGFLAACGGGGGGGGGGGSTSMMMTTPDGSETPTSTFSVATTPASGTLQRTKVEELDFSDVFSASPMAYSATGLPAGLTLDPATGKLTGVTAATGAHIVTLTGTASDNQTAETSFTLTLTDTNAAPTLAMPLEDFTLRQDKFVPVTLDLDSYFTDTDVTDSLNFRASGALPEGLEFSGPNASIESSLSRTPTPTDPQANAVLAGTINSQGLEGVYTLTITVDDGNSDGRLIEELVITIKAQGNTAPVLRPGLALENAFKRAESLDIDLSEFFMDPDYGASAPTYTVSGLPAGLSLSNGKIVGMVEDGVAVGPVTVKVTVSDADDGQSVFDLSLTLVEDGANRAPRLKQAPSDQILPENRLFSLDLGTVFEDQDTGDTLTYAVSAARAGDNGPVAGLPAGLTLSNGNRILSGAVTEEDALGVYTLTLTAMDDSGDTGMDSASHSFVLTVVNVNDAPEGAIPTQTVALSAAIRVDLSSLISDAEGDDVTYAFTSPAALPLTLAPGASVLTGMATSTAGTFTVTVTATDAHDAASEFVFTIEALPAADIQNRAPSVVTTGASPALAALTAMEGEAFTQDIAAWFTDADGDTLTYTATSLNVAEGPPTPVALPEWLTLDGATGALTIADGATDDPQVREHTLVLTASDPSGATAVHTAVLTVQNLEETPTLTPGPSVPVAGATFTVAEGVRIGWAAGSWFMDPDGDSLTFTGTLEKSGETPVDIVDIPTGWLVLGPNGGLTIAADATTDAEVGLYTLTVTATDVTDRSVEHVVHLTITNVPDAPVLKDANAGMLSAVDEGAAGVWTVSDLFTDPDAGDADPTSFVINPSDLPAGGWLTWDSAMHELAIAAGVTDDAQVGEHTIMVTVADAVELTLTNEVAITVTVVSVDEPPTLTTLAPTFIFTQEGLALDEDVSNWFEDPDLEAPGGIDSLTFKATLETGGVSVALPDSNWLVLDAATGALTIARGAADDAHVSGSRPDIAADLAGEDDGDTLPSWLALDETTGMLVVVGAVGTDTGVGAHTLTVTATDTSGASIEYAALLWVEETMNEPVASGAPFVQGAGPVLSLNLPDYFTDLNENGTANAPSNLTFEASTSRDDTAAGNVVTAMVGELQLLVDENDDLFPVQLLELTFAAGDPAARAQETVTITASDSDGGRVELELVIGPAAPDGLSVMEGAAADWNVSGWFTDPDGDTLTYTAMLLVDETADDERPSVEELPAWLVLNGTTGALTIASGMTDDAQVGEHTVLVAASDGTTRPAVHVVTVTVENVGESPAVASDAPTTPYTVMEGVTFSVDVSAWFTDPDLTSPAGVDSFTFEASLQKSGEVVMDSLPDWLVLDDTTGALTIAAGAADDDQVGMYEISVTATDSAPGESVTHVVTLTITDVPESPETTTLAPTATENQLTAMEGLAANWDVSTWFIDPDGDSLTFTATLPSVRWLTFEGGSMLVINAHDTDDVDVGEHIVTVTASDGVGGTADTEHTVTLTIENVDEAPVATGVAQTIPSSSFTVMEGAAMDWDISSWFRDPDAGDTLTFTAMFLDTSEHSPGVSLPTGWLTLDAATGALAIAVNATDDAEVGLYALAITATDSTDRKEVIAVALIIENDPEAPVTTTLAPTVALTALEGMSAVWEASTWFDDSDEDVGALTDVLTFKGTLQKTGGDAGALPDWLVLNAETGALSIAADATNDDEVGDYTLTVTATDESGGVTHSITHQVDLTIENVDEAPVVTSLAPTSTKPLRAAATRAFSVDVSDWFTDEDASDSVTFTASGLPSWLTLTSGNALTITAGDTSATHIGSHSFTITATDTTPTTPLTTTLEVTLSVREYNAPPTVMGTPPTELTADEGDAFDENISNWFEDPTNDPLTLSLENAPTWLTLAGGNMLTISESATDDAQVGTYTFTVIADDSLATTTAMQIVTLTIENVAEPPVTTTDAPTTIFVVNEGEAWTEDVSAWFEDDDENIPGAPAELTYTATLELEDVFAATPPDWLVLDTATGALTIAAGATDDAQVEIYILTITATDDTGGVTQSVSHTIGLEIKDVLEVPVTTSLAPDDISVAEELALVENVSGWFEDDDTGDTLTYVATQVGGAALPGWLLLDDTTGDLLIGMDTTNDAEVGVYTLEVTASDGVATTDNVVHSVTLSITNVAEAPVHNTVNLMADFSVVDVRDDDPRSPRRGRVTIDEGEALALDASRWFTDEDTMLTSNPDVLTYTRSTLQSNNSRLTPSETWLVLNGSTGALTVASGAADDGDASGYWFTVTATDSTSKTAIQIIHIGIENVPEAPTLTDSALTQLTAMEGEAASWNVSGWFRDPDNLDPLVVHLNSGRQDLTFTARGGPIGDWLTFTNGMLTIAATDTTDAHVGSHTFTVTATDDSSGTLSFRHTVTISIEGTPDAPTLTDAAPTAAAPLTATEGESHTWDVSTWFGDPDAGDSLTFKATNLHGILMFDRNTNILSIGEGATDDEHTDGRLFFTVTATDTSGMMLAQRFTLTVENVEEAPVTTTDAPTVALTAAQGMMLSEDVSEWFTDPDGDSLTYTAMRMVGVAFTDLPTWLVLNDMTGALTIADGGTDNDDVGRPYRLVVTASDGSLSATHTFSLSITDVNDPTEPAGNFPAQTIALDEGEAWSLTLTNASFRDPDMEDFTIMVGSKPDFVTIGRGSPTNVPLSIADGATDDEHVGVRSIDVVVTEESGGVETHTIWFTIANVEEAPVTTPAAMDDLTADEGVGVSWDLSLWFADEDTGDILTYAAMQADGSALPTWLMFNTSSGALTIENDGTDDDEVGAYTLVITATDDDADTPRSVTHRVTLTVVNVNEPPVPDTSFFNPTPTVTLMEGESFYLNVANNSFTEPEGESLTFMASSSSDIFTFNTLSDRATVEVRIMTLTTDDDDIGMHSVSVVVTEGTSGGMTTQTINFEITNVNEAPTLNDGVSTSLSVIEGTSRNLDVAAWFDDPDTDDNSFDLEVSGNPGWLRWNDTTSMLSFSAPNDAQVGMHTIEITASDSDDPTLNTVLTFTLTILNVTEPPEATSAAPTLSMPVSVMEGIAWNVDLSSWFFDPDGMVPGRDAADIAYSVTGLPGGDWLVWDNTSMFSIEAHATDDDQVGLYSFMVTATDNNGSMTHEAYIEITDVANEPELSMPLPNRIIPASGNLELDLSTYLADMNEDGDVQAFSKLTVVVTDSIGDSAGENLVAAEEIPMGTSILTLTPETRARTALWEQETISLTVTDAEGGRLEAEFAVHSRQNVIDLGELDPAHGFIIQGMADAMAGQIVAAAGDVDGDGIDDLLVRDGDGNFTGAKIVYGIANPDGGVAGSQFGTAVQITATGVTINNGATTTSFGETTTDGGAMVTVSLSEVDVPQDVLDASIMRQVLKLSEGTGFFDFRTFHGINAVSGVGDINGDGFADFIAGPDSGATSDPTYVVFGKSDSDGMKLSLIDPRQETPIGFNDRPEERFTREEGFRIISDGSPTVGASVAGAGDINGDGIDDLILEVGSLPSSLPSNQGAYIIYGKPNPAAADGEPGTQFGMPGTILYTLTAETALMGGNDGTVTDVTHTAGVGSVFTLGDDDMVTGTLSVPGGGDTVFTLAANHMSLSDDTIQNQIIDVANLAADDGFLVTGFDNRASLSVSRAGDVNGDGLADLIVGDTGAGSSMGGEFGASFGKAYIIYGKASPDGTQFGTANTDAMGAMQVLDLAMLAADDGFILQGDSSGDRLGFSVSGAGDVNGDGLDDLIVGAKQGSDGGNRAGEAYIIYGKAGADGTQFGTAVRVDADGMLIASDATPVGWTDRQVLDTSSLAAADGFILQGGAESELGFSVAGAGDINGDGLADLIAGAHFNGNGGTQAGEAYVIYGKAGNGTQFGTAVTADGETRQVLDATALAPEAGFILRGDMENDQLGTSVSGAGDINGDGFDDLIVGAPNGGDGGMEAGEAYVIYGGTHLGEVVTYDQTIESNISSGAVLRGGAGNDRLSPFNEQVIYGGAGDDTLDLLIPPGASFRRVDGGSGVDTLILGSGLDLDFTDPTVLGKFRSIEVLSLLDFPAMDGNPATGAMVTLDLAAVHALVEDRDNGGTLTDAGEVLLRVQGPPAAMVTLVGNWVETTDAEDTADLWTLGSAKVLIDDGLYIDG